MPSKIKNRPYGGKAPLPPAKLFLLRDVMNPTTLAYVASRPRPTARPLAPAVPNHLRHHVSRHAQAS